MCVYIKVIVTGAGRRDKKHEREGESNVVVEPGAVHRWWWSNGLIRFFSYYACKTHGSWHKTQHPPTKVCVCSKVSSLAYNMQMLTPKSKRLFFFISDCLSFALSLFVNQITCVKKTWNGKLRVLHFLFIYLFYVIACNRNGPLDMFMVNVYLDKQPKRHINNLGDESSKIPLPPKKTIAITFPFS